MATSHADVAIESFLEVESRFADFIRHVPVEKEHLRVHSPVLAAILLDTCSLLETILKSSMDNARYNGVANIGQHRARRYTNNHPYLNINDLRAVFRGDAFYSKPVWYVPRSDRSFPWYPWRTAGGQHPAWWTAYNRMKHSRFEEAGQAKLGTTMHAMEGLYLALVQSLDFRAALVTRGIVNAPGLTAAQLQLAVAGWEPLATPATVVATSGLFGYKYLSTGSPTAAADVVVFR